MGPLIYGYMKVPCDVVDSKIRALEEEIRLQADKNGFTFVTFFYELECSSRDAFYELKAELKRSDAHYVIVPSLNHFAHSRMLQNMMLSSLEFDSDAEVFDMSER